MTDSIPTAGQLLSISERAVVNQLAGIASPQYEVGVYDASAFGGEGRMLLRTWSPNELMNSLVWLRWMNSQGSDVYVRPLAPHAYAMLDDLAADTVNRLDDEGYSPSVVVETSPGNFQAWLYHGEVLDPAISTRVALNLARLFGTDIESADFRHFGRLAGFTNRKPKHRQTNGLHPFVKLHRHGHHLYLNAQSTVAIARADVAALRQARDSMRHAFKDRPRVTRLKRIEDFHGDSRYGGDLNRADLAYSVYALAHGATEEAVAQALRARDLTKKGALARQEAYIRRTIHKAADAAYAAF